MRVRLVFESSPRSCNQHKVCFYLDKESCKNISDLNYLIQKRYFDSKGAVSLYLPGNFYFPPQESINVIQENDILNVKFFPRGTVGINVKEGETNVQKKRKLSQTLDVLSSSSSESSASSSEDEAKTKKERKKPVLFKNKKTTITIKQKDATVKPNQNFKKVVPLSKLGVIAPKLKKKNTSSSDSSPSSSSESDSTETEKFPSPKATKKSDKSNDVFMKPFPIKVKGSVPSQKQNVIPTQAKKVKTVQSKKTSSTSDSSETSDEDDNDDKTQNTTKSANIDFHVSNLSKNATSTPSHSFMNQQNTRCTPNASNESVTETKKNFALHLASKDVYKNVSQIMTSGTNTDNTNKTNNNNNSNINNSRNIINNASMGTSTNSQLSNTSSASSSQANSSKDPPVSGKTLRARRRRHRRLEASRADKLKKSNGTDENDNVPLFPAKPEKKMNTGDVEIPPPPSQPLLSNGTTVNENTKINGEKLDQICDVEMQPSSKQPLPNGVTVDENTKTNGHVPNNTKDYSIYSSIEDGPPQDTCIIAFKLYDMDNNYQPYITNYQEAELISYNDNTRVVELQFCEGFKNRKGKIRGKFALEDEHVEINDVIFKEWNELLEPRFIKPVSNGTCS